MDRGTAMHGYASSVNPRSWCGFAWPEFRDAGLPANLPRGRYLCAAHVAEIPRAVVATRGAVRGPTYARRIRTRPQVNGRHLHAPSRKSDRNAIAAVIPSPLVDRDEHHPPRVWRIYGIFSTPPARPRPAAMTFTVCTGTMLHVYSHGQRCPDVISLPAWNCACGRYERREC